MPETRELMVRGGGAAAVGELSGGYFIRQVTSPGAAAVAAATAAAARKQRARRVWATDNKENVPPWAVVARNRSRTRRSPLPEWYPRTPLRDITVIVNAIERQHRRRRRATAAQRRTRENIEASASPDTTSSPQEPSVSSEDIPPIHSITPSDVSSTTSLTSLIEGLNISPSPTPLSLPTGESSSLTRSVSNDPSPAVSLIDEMQRLVMENLRRAPQAAQPCKKKSTTAAQRSSALMSMR